MSVVARQPLIAAHVSPITKANFAALAARQGQTESSLLVLLIDTVLDDNPVRRDADSFDRSAGLTARVGVRLRPGDRARINARAAARGMRPASYLAALIRSHVRHDAPLPAAELNALKLAVNHLSIVGRALSDLAQSRTASADSTRRVEQALKDVSVRVADVLRTVRDLVRCNLISWESDDV